MIRLFLISLIMFIQEVIILHDKSFINRESELRFLEELWESDKAELIIVWGRRRIGKTRLLMEFSKNKRSLYLYIYHAAEKSLLEFLTKEIKRQLNISFPPGYVFPNWNAFFSYLAKLSKEKRIIVIFDEFQRLIDISPTAIDLLQYWWDSELNASKIKIILVGSSIGMIERVALSGSSPLFGRKTGLMNLKSMNFFDFIKGFKAINPVKLIELYAVFGGTPHYFNMIEPEKSVEENIVEKIASPYAPLRDEPEQLLRTELRTISVYMDILEKIARRNSISVGEIASSMNKSRSETYPYLIRLEKMDIVSREYKPTEKRKEYRRARFRITDNYFRFWFNFIYPNYHEIERGNIEIVIDSYRENKNKYITFIYEDIIRDFLLRNSGKIIKDATERMIKLPEIKSVGRWWWKNTEIDVCAIGDRYVILGEVKWQDKSIIEKTIKDLVTVKTKQFIKKTDIEKPIRYLIATKTPLTGKDITLIREINGISIVPQTIIQSTQIPSD